MARLLLSLLLACTMGSTSLMSAEGVSGPDASEKGAPAQGGRDGLEGVPDRLFTLEELRRYDGTDPSLPIMLAVKGVVFNVTAGAKFYGKGKAYSKFAGRDITRCTAVFSTEDADLDRTDFPPEKQKYLDKVFNNTYQKKYVMYGRIENHTPQPSPGEQAGNSKVTFQGAGGLEWRGVTSVEDGKKETYYWNPKTDEVCWEKPEGFDGSWATQAYETASAFVYSVMGWDQSNAKVKSEFRRRRRN
mmetsp:Transcript_45582/g.110928  ORF Transcript_45582/g.110928 Transcript_45582/m.110928 type:complete len:245 (-) Transcript_45582:234-968(-)